MKRLLMLIVILIVMPFASSATIFNDDFEDGDLAGWSLTTQSGANPWSNSNTDPRAGLRHAQANPSSTTEPASVMERTVSTLGYENITFKYYRKLIGIDSGDEFQVEYNTGAGWNIVEQTALSAVDDLTYVYMEFNLSSLASNNSNFQIKFECTAGAVSEFCRVDDIAVEGNAIDVTAPIVNLESPVNNTFTSIASVIFNASFTDNVALKNATIYLWNSTNSLINTTSRNITGTSNSTAISITLPYQGRFYWNYIVTDNNNNRAFNSTNFTVNYDSTSPSVSINYPQNNGRYSTVQTALNFSVSDVNLQSCWYSTNNGLTNTTVTCGNNITGLNSGQGNSTWRVYSNDSAGNTNSTNITFSVDSINPSVNIVHPSNGSTLGNNVSISLNFSVSDVNLQSCWYSINSASNISLSNCGNTTFNISDGSHTIRVYANDSFGNFGLSSSSFNVQVGAPSINIISPSNAIYLNSSIVLFNFTATDPTLSTCGLYGDFNGSYGLNQTNSTMISGASSIFNLTLVDNSYLWAISCNDTLGNRATTSNRTLNVDTGTPAVTLTEPSGTYTNISNIPLTFSYSDASPVQCFYNVTFIATGLLVTESEITNCENTTFNVNIESDYFLTLTVNDSAGNTNITRNTFTVTSPSGGGTPGGSSGSSSGGGGGGSSFIAGNPYGLGFGILDKLKIHRGDSESIILPVTNKGLRFLNNCLFSAQTGVSEWISGQDIYSLSPGQSLDYIFTVNAPIDAEVGDYFVTLGLKCKEINSSISYQIEVLGGEFELNILESERVGTKLSVTYSIENFADEIKNLELKYKLIDFKNELVTEGSFDNVEIAALETVTRTSDFELPRNSIGEYTLIMELSDGLDLNQKQQSIRLTSGSISGFAISDNNLRSIAWFGIVVLLLSGMFIVIKLIRNQIAIRKANEEMQRQFITIDLN